MSRIPPDDHFRPLLVSNVLDPAQSASNRHDVYRSVAAPNTDHIFGTDLHPTRIEGFQKLDARHTVRCSGPALNRHISTGLATDGPQDRIKVLFQFFYTDFPSDSSSRAYLNIPQFDDAFDLTVENIARGTVGRYAVAEHTAELVLYLENRRCVAFAAQLKCACQTGRAPANDGHLFSGQHRGVFVPVLLPIRRVSDKLFNRVDTDKIVDVVTIATSLTRRRTDPAHHRRKRIG